MKMEDRSGTIDGIGKDIEEQETGDRRGTCDKRRGTEGARGRRGNDRREIEQRCWRLGQALRLPHPWTMIFRQHLLTWPASLWIRLLI